MPHCSFNSCIHNLTQMYFMYYMYCIVHHIPYICKKSSFPEQKSNK